MALQVWLVQAAAVPQRLLDPQVSTPVFVLVQRVWPGVQGVLQAPGPVPTVPEQVPVAQVVALPQVPLPVQVFIVLALAHWVWPGAHSP